MEKQLKHNGGRNAQLSTGWMTMLVLIAGLVLPLSGHVNLAMAQENDDVQSSQPAENWGETNPRSDLWRQARQSYEGYTAVDAPAANVLMSSDGETFRQVRMGPVSTYLPWWLAFMVGAMLLLHIFTGGGEKLGNPSGKRYPAWSMFDRILHWYVAGLFLILALTGLSLLFGRAVLLPLIGPEAFSALARGSKFIHDWGGPFFVVGVVVMSVAWLHHNKPTMMDIRWLLFGGAFGKHLPAGRYNGGQKIWFLVNVLAGVVVCVTGVLLLLPDIFENRTLFQINLIVHAVVAVLWIGVSFAHIYMATLGAPGGIDITTKGHVSSEWVKVHRSAWYEEAKDEVFYDEKEKTPAP
ncbi:MAG: formate dehydrogenase subunit gamma [Wenzhouxiangella sp.]|jgi:formate dehydrogenase subunit gamma|nr:formate dehydrogenase subunit gamma [Wenzhouxiangella sp.]